MNLLSRFFRSLGSMNLVVVGDFNALLDCLSVTGRQIRSRFFVPADRTGNGNRLTQAYFDHRLFLANISLCHKQPIFTGCPPPSQPWTHIGHVSTGHRLHGSIEDWRSFRSVFCVVII